MFLLQLLGQALPGKRRKNTADSPNLHPQILTMEIIRSVLTVGAEASAVGADSVVLAAVVAQPHAAPVALPALRADAVTRLAGTVQTAVEATALWKENDVVKSRFVNTLIST